MQDGPIQAPETREISPFDPARDHSAHLSRRTYNLLMGALIDRSRRASPASSSSRRA